MRQSTMPISSARGGVRAASSDLPAGRSAASSRVTAWPRSARDARGLQPGRAGADDDDAARRRRGLRDDMRACVASRPVAALWMQSASRALIDAVEAVGRADAGADLVLAARHDLC